MSEPIRDSPSVARPYCPRCEPDIDPSDRSNGILDVRWCSNHPIVNTGIDDEAVSMASYPAGSTEAGGEDNRRWCALFHRTRRVNARTSSRTTKSSS